MDQSLLYVSKSLLEFPKDNAEVLNIEAVARSRNLKLGVTGALISTPAAFAQILEGPQAAISELMASISCDSRHSGVKVLGQCDIGQRRFPRWAMVYSGPSHYVSRQLQPLLNMPAAEIEPSRIKQLVRFMEGLARDIP